MIDNPKPGQEKVKQQGIYESLIRDMMVENPFPENDGNPVQIWQGCEDRIISCQIQRYVAERLPWIKYYEIADGGQLLPHNTTVVNAVLRSLLMQKNHLLYKNGQNYTRGRM
ncbi:hypothetical protein MKW98_003735 [Papaver atlanticum]|uniref:Uncharacterized protein n=1 Tax=Papaver atlanticum TaxID=357466 RepID=A0AAD4T895_9MAGN|nr:hypothetical protein MKW98_003735 [Papaver atlanticum]